MVSRIFALALVATTLIPQAASAVTYSFAFTTATDTASGRFTTVAGAPSGITSITGKFDGFTITGLSPYASADNVLQAATPFATYSGISFTANAVNYNLYGNGGGFLTNSVTDPGGYGTGSLALTSLNVAAVPEPATWGLMITGVAMTGFAMRRRRVTVAA